MLSIREATLEDVPALVEIIRAAFRPVANRFGLTEENCPGHPSHYTSDWLRSDFERGHRYSLICEADMPCGCVATHQDPGMLWLERLSVLPERQGQGYGQMLVEHVVGLAEQIGVEKVFIGIIAEHHELRSWYEKVGFFAEETIQFPNFPFPVLFMQRPVD